MSVPAWAETVVENEALVMRLIFDDCLGYVQRDQVPFRGLATRPVPPSADSALFSPVSSRIGTVELLSARYLASWGATASDRYCRITRATYGSDAHRATLGVRRSGFVERVTARAARHGLTGHDGDELSPVLLASWYQPGRDAATGPDRAISFTILPTAQDVRADVVEIGTFVMGGPPLPKPAVDRRR